MGHRPPNLSVSVWSAMLPAGAAVVSAYPRPSSYKNATQGITAPSDDTLDRKALPTPDGNSLLQRLFETPAGEIETTIAALWSEPLHVETVGRHDHFFKLGGHSLLVGALMEQLRRRGLVSDIRTLFNTTTLAVLTAAVQKIVMAKI